MSALSLLGNLRCWSCKSNKLVNSECVFAVVLDECDQVCATSF